MDTPELIKLEYLTIREEICATKDRLFKIMGFGLLAVPGSHFLAQTYKVDTVTLSLPVLIVIVALIYLSENNALMRGGKYIREYVENNRVGFIGWETWLERDSHKTRDVDKYLSYAFCLLFLLYFMGSAFIAVRHAYTCYGEVAGSMLLGTYVAVGIWFSIFLLNHIKNSTK